jgi:hypothetical protein
MTRDDIIKLAREAGVGRWDAQEVAIERFAALVAEREREECAKVADSQDGDDEGDAPDCTWSRCARHIAAAIRAIGETK